MINKADFQAWKIQTVTKHFLKHAEQAQQEMREQSRIRDTVDQTAMQTSYAEGFIEGVDALCVFIEDLILEHDNEEESNED